MPVYGTSGLGSLFGSTGAASSTSSGLWAESTWVTSSNSAAYMAAMANQTTATSTQGIYWAANTQEMWVTPTQYFELAQQRVGIYHERTAEQVRLDAERTRAALQAERERRAAYEQARARSRELLLTHLTEAQRKTFRDNKWFVIQGGKTRTRYRIRDAGHAGNIDVMQGERVTHRLCCHCDHTIPVYDNMLAQKLTLECDEEAFLRLANRHAA